MPHAKGWHRRRDPRTPEAVSIRQILDGLIAD